MDTQFTFDELKNIAALINIAQIKGSEALTVALLQQKISKLVEILSNTSQNAIVSLDDTQKTETTHNDTKTTADNGNFEV